MKGLCLQKDLYNRQCYSSSTYTKHVHPSVVIVHMHTRFLVVLLLLLYLVTMGIFLSQRRHKQIRTYYVLSAVYTNNRVLAKNSTAFSPARKALSRSALMAASCMAHGPIIAQLSLNNLQLICND